MRTYSFENLASWQHARLLSVWVYKATLKFPSEEKYGLVSQMRRAAVSIASNLAEGSSRSTAKDKANFSTMSYSSAVELLNHLIISRDLNYIPEDIYDEGRKLVEHQTYLIATLRKTQIPDKE